MTDFQKKVYSATKVIPRGQTRSYREVAISIGRPHAHRAVATALSKNRSSEVPCHRVIHSNGQLGGYSMGGPSRKRKLLLQEKAI